MYYLQSTLPLILVLKVHFITQASMHAHARTHRHTKNICVWTTKHCLTSLQFFWLDLFSLPISVVSFPSNTTVLFNYNSHNFLWIVIYRYDTLKKVDMNADTCFQTPYYNTYTVIAMILILIVLTFYYSKILHSL